ncbi:sensor histidine kinase [Mucilaginibacter sp. HMF5004]|uniref:sensor histidine kinase n=1 Tax=Mucilaginibacter rivuli TaxID=2857527 RepID=UPI001C60043D|nr:7TM diverse intracellular signaling domain-containing protein [Mucilaginibacter rivuli]MBW4889464.1 sensor histidine kinase [Mucilaginibacter rivuli]
MLLLILSLLSLRILASTDTLTLHGNETKLINKNYFTALEDPTRNLTINDILKNAGFKTWSSSLPSLKVSNPVIWLKLVLRNKTNQPYIPISINASVIECFDLYIPGKSGEHPVHLSVNNNNKQTLLPKANMINCTLMPDSARTIYLRIESNVPNSIPIEFSSAERYFERYSSKTITFGIFMGIVIIMMFYNLLLFFVVKENSYLYYVAYIIFLGVSQALTRNYGYSLVNPSLYNNYLVPFSRIFFWLSILLFVTEFLQLRNQNKNIFKFTMGLAFLFATPILFIATNNFNFAYGLITVLVSLGCISLLAIGIYMYKKGYKPAKFFMLGWCLFLISVLVSVGRSKGYVPYNDFTADIVLITSTIELVIFSIALADKINFYRSQNIDSQSLALRIARENERLITEQNIMLESKVVERTRELLESNRSLTRLIENLKEAQFQLVETEKMASLGQLTAGIAHEINNPINFVKSNIKPLKLDMDEVFTLLDMYSSLEQAPIEKAKYDDIIKYKENIDLNYIKTEITELLNGIEDGAARTAEIIQSLRAFSRTDEVELKLTDINKTILSTLVILRSSIPYYIEITPVLDKLPMLNCYPGKISQVFMNIIQNGIQAIIEKEEHQKESILIVTKDYPENITIEITDTGVGMTEKVKQKIYDPFFTTKDVGEGTGLGLSIVFGIIEKHQGHIEVTSEPGKGASFLIMLPKTLE